MAFLRCSFLFLMLIGLGLAQAEECPPFWNRFGSHCYRFFGHNKTWQEAENHCQMFFNRHAQGHLASIKSQVEFNLVLTMWKTSLPPPILGLYLGGIKTDSFFSWSDDPNNGIAGFVAWLPNEPNNSGGMEDCMATTVDGWNDVPCTETFPHVCKIRIE
ncbi:alpha-N-acetylgalactosamine-specific lectin-like [Patiria miniata]|uniref:C-type lectin domain-containing protein n=1 Tax=Patiria miniata TaxID=46514 RepID=A0A914AMR2_PATMI|nr:alpha-N-acetylgalactosamine-specific lectin-like [Patiria miniata]